MKNNISPASSISSWSSRISAWILWSKELPTNKHKHTHAHTSVVYHVKERFTKKSIQNLIKCLMNHSTVTTRTSDPPSDVWVVFTEQHNSVSMLKNNLGQVTHTHTVTHTVTHTHIEGMALRHTDSYPCLICPQAACRNLEDKDGE